MKEFRNELINKFSYSDEIVNFLCDIVVLMGDYFGSEYLYLIRDRLLSCEIHFKQEGEDSNEYLDQYFGNDRFIIDKFKAVYCYDLLKNEDGLFLKEIIYINNSRFNFSDSIDIGVLIHEICHMIKVRIKNLDKVSMVQLGLSNSYFSYDNYYGEFDFISSENIGLDEAMNCYDEFNITKKYLGHYEKSSCEAMRFLFLELYNFIDLFSKFQLLSSDRLGEKFGNDFNKISQIFDKLYFSIMNNKKDFDNIKTECYFELNLILDDLYVNRDEVKTFYKSK